MDDSLFFKISSSVESIKPRHIEVEIVKWTDQATQSKKKDKKKKKSKTEKKLEAL
jgi:hypothetical protein